MTLTLIEKEGVHDARTFYAAIKSSNLVEDESAAIHALEDYASAVKRAANLAPDYKDFLFFQGAVAGMLMAFKIQQAFLAQTAREQGLDPATGRKPEKPH